jgi:hypothetical protein
VTKRVAGSINTLSNEGASTARDNPRTATPHSDTYPQRAHGQNSSAVRVTTGIRCLDIIRNNPTCIQTIIEGYSKIYTTTPTCIRTTSEGYSNTYTTTPTTHATNPRMMNNDLHDNSYDIHDQLPRTIQNLHNTSYDQRLPIEQRHIQLHHNHYHPETTTVRKRGRQRRPRYFATSTDPVFAATGDVKDSFYSHAVRHICYKNTADASRRTLGCCRECRQKGCRFFSPRTSTDVDPSQGA